MWSRLTAAQAEGGTAVLMLTSKSQRDGYERGKRRAPVNPTLATRKTDRPVDLHLGRILDAVADTSWPVARDPEGWEEERVIG